MPRSRLTASDCVWQFLLRFLCGEALVERRRGGRHLLMCEVSAASFHHAPTAASIPLSLIHPALHEKLLQPCRVLR